MATSMEKRRVGTTELTIDVLGLGGATLGGAFAELVDRQAVELIQAARDAGFTYFDTAPLYGFGRSERAMGDRLRGTDYVLSDKVGRLLRPGPADKSKDFGMVNPLPFHVAYDYSYDGIMRAYEDNLQRLGLDRIDILLAHDIGTYQHGDENAHHFRDLADSGYRAMDELRATGAVKAIGLGVNENEVCEDALRVGNWDVFLLAGRYTLLEQTAMATLFPACRKAGTTIICGGPFNSGILVGREMWNYATAPAEVVAKVKEIAIVADSHSVPMAAAAIQFPLANDIVTSVIPGPRHKDELAQILDWFNTPIPGAFWLALKADGLMESDAPVPAGD